ncbi:MAG: hypothetical protein LC733_13725, partial [Actinobacteria bacterium]|nr:hypothetical protein [Actinomycetota bacterium]
MIVLIGAVGVNLLGGAAVAAGIVPQLGNEVHVAAEGPALATPAETVAVPAGAPVETPEAPATPAETVPVVTSAPPVSFAATSRA